MPICEVKQLLDEKRSGAIKGFLREEAHDILQYYPQPLFFPELEAQTKEEALQKLVFQVEKLHPLPTGFYEAVCKREKMAHTCMGNRCGNAASLSGADRGTFVSVAVLKAPIQ